MTPEQDSLKLYDWRLTHVDIGNQSWSVTIPVSQAHNCYWRRLKRII